jgi:glutamine amidotransferase
MSDRIAIIDYGMANLRSVQKGFEHVGAAATIVSTPEQIDHADRIVLPGVGAFRDAVATLQQRGIDEAVKRHIAAGKPFLGICLGLQMLFEVGYEDGEWPGLGVLKGRCVRLEVDRTHRLKVPHMGWNQLRRRTGGPLLEGLSFDAGVYFVHSYHVEPADASAIATTTDYGIEFVSSVWKDNVVATQFHPEKSQAAGLTMLKNFATWRV